MDLEEINNRRRLIGDYILGPKIGSGSFAVVWLSRHRSLGLDVAIKEIDKKRLNHKLSDNLHKEITILRNIRHPNIIRFYEAIQTVEKIYLVLEYCNGGDLAAYLHNHGRVSEAVARHFMRQLASGLHVLHENNLIHRDLKPQNLLLSTNDATAVLKIGDFGFARYLTPQGLADTLCGSPLYMAPEIIRNQKYDAKADLWSVGAILFQLVAGKPPFDGDSQFQLFQNILTCNELQFPPGVLEDLHPDCVDLCRSLLRLNPVERLTFVEFFNHRFMEKPRATESACECMLNTTSDSLRKSVGDDPSNSSDPVSMKTGSMDQRIFSTSALRVTDSLESIEQEYVLVNAHVASTGTLCFSLEASMQDSSADRVFNCAPKNTGKYIAVAMHTGEVTGNSVCGRSHESAPLAVSHASAELGDVQGPSPLQRATRLQLLHQYVHALSELALEKLNAGMHLESFSVELVALALWREAHNVCSSWVASSTERDSRRSCSTNECTPHQDSVRLSHNSEEYIDFSRPASAYSWVERGFIVAYEQAEKISNFLQDMDGSVEMPDAMEVIYQTALAAGKSGAFDELKGNRSSAAAAYSKATVLLSFIVGEATSLPLNPPFLLTVADRMRIQRYIIILKAHQTHSQMPQPSPKLTRGSPSK